MTPENAILAGTAARLRERLGELHRLGESCRLGPSKPGSQAYDVALDRTLTKVALDAVEDHLTKRLKALGVTI